MRYAHTVHQVRAAEAPLLATGMPLMARAATGLACAVARRLPGVYGARVALLVGTGNNGADALYAGAWLARRGAHVVAVLAGAPVPAAYAAFLRDGGRPGTPEALADAEVVLDGLVGIGASGPLRAASVALVAQVGDAFLVAVDVPSGVDADTGEVHAGAVRADLTVTFGCLKPGLLLAREQVGQVEVIEIGLALPPGQIEVLDDADVRRLWPAPRAGEDKYSRGVLGVVAGSPTYTGAAVLTVGAALRSGVGMVRYVGSSQPVRTRWPEAIVTETVADTGRVQAWVVGPGLEPDALEVLVDVLGRPEPVLVDASALTVCAAHPYLLQRREAPTVITPHAGEFDRFALTPDGINADRIGAARSLAADLGAHVLLKGDATVVAAPDGRVRVNSTGSAYLAAAGSGDVLAGAIGALLAQGLDPFDAASVGAHLHGLAGARAASSAGALLDAWPATVAGVRAGD